ncbi:MAG: aromatic ring-hydroxylating dioxygenase subunit alpha [Alphaproteobacteria bacterium]|nr:aromatic ring-hydroxylating dioxygenase subunit alpha [Alphaproteobacteria bacterium]
MPNSAASSAQPLREAWYYALAGKALSPGAMVAKKLLGEDIVLCRPRQGPAFALKDFCPHRGMPLRFGRFDGETIECCYHGWRFGSEGRCTKIPSLVDGQALDPAKIRTRSYPAIERQGGIWIYFGDDSTGAPPPPTAPSFAEDAAPSLYESMRFSCGIDHAVVGLMDPAHGPFVHEAWWWRGRNSAHEKAKAFAPSEFGFTMTRHRPSSNSAAYKILGGVPETEIVFRLPGVRIEHVAVGRHALVNLTAVTPIDERATEIHHSIFWTMPWLSVLRPILRPFARKFLAQDRDIMAKQQLGLTGDPTLMLIDDADTQAKWYYRLKREYAAARAEKRRFENPVKPRTLRWKS